MRRMEVSEKRDLHAELRELQQQRGDAKRRLWELELKQK